MRRHISQRQMVSQSFAFVLQESPVARLLLHHAQLRPERQRPADLTLVHPEHLAEVRESPRGGPLEHLRHSRLKRRRLDLDDPVGQLELDVRGANVLQPPEPLVRFEVVERGLVLVVRTGFSAIRS